MANYSWAMWQYIMRWWFCHIVYTTVAITLMYLVVLDTWRQCCVTMTRTLRKYFCYYYFDLSGIEFAGWAKNRRFCLVIWSVNSFSIDCPETLLYHNSAASNYIYLDRGFYPCSMSIHMPKNVSQVPFLIQLLKSIANTFHNIWTLPLWWLFTHSKDNIHYPTVDKLWHNTLKSCF